MTSPPAPLLVAAYGNVMAADDAFGPRVVERLGEMSLPDVQLLNQGMKPLGLLDHLPGRSDLIVVDAAAADAPFEVGELIVMDFFDPDRPALMNEVALSSHGISLTHELQLARQLELLPTRVSLVSAVVVTTSLGEPMSQAMSGLVGPAAQRIADLASR